MERYPVITAVMTAPNDICLPQLSYMCGSPNKNSQQDWKNFIRNSINLFCNSYRKKLERASLFWEVKKMENLSEILVIKTGR